MPKTHDKYLNVNQKAQITFNNLKRKMKLDLGFPLITEAIEEGTGHKVEIDREKIEKLLNGEVKSIPELEQFKAEKIPKESYKKIENINDSVENIFEFIDSLELDPKLSLAIGLIISYKNTKNTEDLRKAIEALMTEGKFEEIRN